MNDENIRQVTEHILTTHVYPGLAFCVVSREGTLYAYGAGLLEDDGAPATPETIYDLASLTKVVATTPVVLRLAEMGWLSLKDQARTWIPDLPEGLRLYHLLTHSSGIIGELPLWEGDLSDQGVIHGIVKDGMKYGIGEHVEYSCMGFILLDIIIKRLTARTVAELAQQWIWEPLGMNHTRYTPPKEWLPLIAPTKMVNGVHLRGVVNDDNARSRGGISGNAGVFSSVIDLGRYVRMLLNRGTLDGVRVLSPHSVDLMMQDRTPGKEEDRTIGWILGPTYHMSPDFISAQSIGHSGSTGTSIVVDMERNIGIIELGNGVYYESILAEERIHARRLLANVLYEAFA